MQYCCRGFQALIDNANNRGLSVMVGYDASKIIRFWLCSRGCDVSQVALVKKLGKHNDGFLINIIDKTGIKYCPFCGTELSSIITLYQKEFAILAGDGEDGQGASHQ